MVLGLVTCRWSMRKEVGKSNPVREEFFKGMIGITRTFTGCLSLLMCLSKLFRNTEAEVLVK